VFIFYGQPLAAMSR